MPKRKKKIIEQPNEATDQTICSNGFNMEVPPIHSLMVDTTTLRLMLGGSFRPCQKYDQVLFQAVNVPADKLHFSMFLAFRAIVDGGFLWVRPELAGMNMFRDCPQVEMGGMVRITKK
jgi:hypothetical protein